MGDLKASDIVIFDGESRQTFRPQYGVRYWLGEFLKGYAIYFGMSEGNHIFMREVAEDPEVVNFLKGLGIDAGELYTPAFKKGIIKTKPRLERGVTAEVFKSPVLENGGCLLSYLSDEDDDPGVPFADVSLYGNLENPLEREFALKLISKYEEAATKR